MTLFVFAHPDPIKDVSAELLESFNFFEQYAAAAYCTDNTNSASGSKLTCTTQNCPLVEMAGATALFEFEKYTSFRYRKFHFEDAFLTC